MSDRLTEEPGILEFLKQLLEIAKESDHPMDRMAVEGAEALIAEKEARAADGARKLPPWLRLLMEKGEKPLDLIEIATDAWDAWQNQQMGRLANNMCLLRDALQQAGEDNGP